MPRAALGQHFLIDRRVLTEILTAANLSHSDIVLEIGPGKGFLTKELLKRVKKVVAIELDETLAGSLNHRLGYPSNLTILNADARYVNLGSIIGMDLPYKVVANLPYYAANHILRRFLESSLPPTLLVVTVQKEVAESIIATKGAMRMLSIGVQVYAKPTIVGYLNPESFKPRPKVQSAIVRLDVLEIPRISLEDREGFFDLVKAGFSSARKQLPNSLSNIYKISTSQIKETLISCGIDPKLRAQSLEIEDWKRLYQVFKRTGIC